MPLTPAQIEAATQFIAGYTDAEEEYHRGLNDMVHDIIRARDDVLHFCDRIHELVADEDAIAALLAAKARVKAAAEELAELAT